MNSLIKQFCHHLGIMLVFICMVCSSVARGEGAQPSPVTSPVPPTPGASQPTEQVVQLSVSSATAIGSDGKETDMTTFGSRIRVKVTNLSERISKDKQFDSRKLILFIDGNAFKGVYPELVDAQGNSLEYVLPDKIAAKDMWKPILRSPPWGGDKKVLIGVGQEEPARELPPTDFKNKPHLQLTLFSGLWSLLLAIIVVVVGIALCAFAKKSNIIRDGTSPPSNPEKLSPYSLAKTQAAIWFFLVFAAFIFIWLMTGSFNGVMTANILALIGIGAGTTLGSAMIEITKSSQDQEQRADIDAKLQTLRQQYEANKSNAAPKEQNDAIKNQIVKLEQSLRPASKNILVDLLTDMNGVTLHRFQMLAWTIALNIVFIVGVYQQLAMPEFDTTLLALMGISSGVYLGFKIPEKQDLNKT